MDLKKMFQMNADRSLYPELDKDGKPIVDLTSHKYLKIMRNPG